jgi:hypothetical protein
MSIFLLFIEQVVWFLLLCHLLTIDVRKHRFVIGGSMLKFGPLVVPIGRRYNGSRH